MTAAPAASPQPSLPAPGELPFTGTAAGSLALLAALLIVAGLTLIVLSHRKVPTHA